jgi:hypothetical protein
VFFSGEEQEIKKTTVRSEQKTSLFMLTWEQMIKELNREPTLISILSNALKRILIKLIGLGKNNKITLLLE